jgi:uncharacterized protein YbjT (DUF2867 family)
VKIYIAGGHGQIALLLARQLATAGHEPVGIIRNPAQSVDLAAIGATSAVLDLEQSDVEQVAAALSGADAVVFAAGAGPGSTAERKLTVDRDGAILLADAAAAAGVQRYVLISAMSADDFDAASDDVFQVYLRAKSEADAAIRASSLDWTIVRPGGLTDDEPTGSVTVGETVERGSIPRADVAALVAEVLVSGSAIGRQFEVVSGGTPIPDALA